jgi:glycosyltransferase involved in cell wall biosynthesis
VAAGFGAKVFDFPWIDDFAAARNESLRHATAEWIFYLDADEWLDHENRERLRAGFHQLRDQNIAHYVNLRSWSMFGRPLMVCEQVRLFRNNRNHRWRYRVHEQILGSLIASGAEIVSTGIFIEHTGYQYPDMNQSKLERNLRLLELDMAEHPNDPYILHYFDLTLRGLHRCMERRRTWQKGFFNAPVLPRACSH